MKKSKKISGIYKIVNTVTGAFYIGSSRNVYKRWKAHKYPSTWNRHPNSKLYQDMEKYGVDKFEFQVFCRVEPEHLKQVEQECIELLKPTYNNRNAKGLNVERQKDSNKKASKKYQQSEKGKEASKKYYQSEKGKEHRKKYQQSEKRKEVQKKYEQSEKGKEAHRKYHNQLCLYNGETLTLGALRKRFRRAGIPNATLEAKKYLI